MQVFKRFLLGLIIWAIPFLTSFFIWDVNANAPTVSMAWFNAIMAFSWSLGFAIAAYLYFKTIRKNACKEGWITGVTWYAELLILDAIFLLRLFGMSFVDYYPMFLTYLNAVTISVAIGYIKK